MQSIVTEGKVHFYQFMEIQILQQYIQKGISYFIDAICNSHPKLISFRYYVEQISLLINFIKDFYYLLKHNANYAQYFYGLQRQEIKIRQINNYKIIKTLYHTAINTILPYLLNKLQLYYINLKQQHQNQGINLNQIQIFFLKVYPYFYCLINLTQFIMKFKYLLFQKVKIYDLNYKLSNCTLKYIEQGDEQDDKKVHYPWQDLLKSPGLLILLTCHKVITWYFNNNNQRTNNNNERNRQVNNNQISKSHQQQSNVNKSASPLSEQNNKKKYTKKCLICSKNFVNPTVIKQNGHVYCYNCIYQYVKKHKQCPITHIKVTQDSLQLIYS